MTLRFNPLIAMLAGSSTAAFFGAFTYFIVGWPRSRWYAIIFLIIALGSAYFFGKTSSVTDIRSRAKMRLIIYRTALALVTFFGIVIAARSPAHTWMSSPWQTLPKYIFIFAGAALILLFTLAAQRALRFFSTAAALFFLTSLNTIVFKNGFGFDVFVHGATVSEWLRAGGITPKTILYSGYYALVMIAQQLLSLPVQTIIQWFVPIALTLALTLVFLQAQRCHSGGIRIYAIIVAIFAIFNPLFTTSTPQALGHIMLFAILMHLWMQSDSPATRREWFAYALIVAGIALIHPLSGVPAIVLILFLWCKKYLPHRAKKTALAALWCALAAGPALLLISLAGGYFDISAITPQALRSLWPHPPNAFQPFIFTKLAYAWSAVAPFALFALATIGFFEARRSQQKKLLPLAALSSALAVSAVAVLAVRMPNVALYEHSSYAERLFLLAELFLIPRAAIGIEWMITRTQNAFRFVIWFLIFCAAFFGWYTAYPAWNSVARSKGINVSSADFELIRTIDSAAHEAPYIVLADQPTSAAALNEFGFTSRRLPESELYFYPIPTGGELYKNFLDLMNNGIRLGPIRTAAETAGVQTVFVVIKPYWNMAKIRSAELKQNAADSFEINGAVVGRFIISSP